MTLSPSLVQTEGDFSTIAGCSVANPTLGTHSHATITEVYNRLKDAAPQGEVAVNEVYLELRRAGFDAVPVPVESVDGGLGCN
jgi:hypothetical protein